MTRETPKSNASQNIGRLDREIRSVIQSLVRFGVEGAETADYKILGFGSELVLAVHLDNFPEWRRGSFEKGSVNDAKATDSRRAVEASGELEWKANPFYALSAEFENIIAGIRLTGFNTVAGIRLGELAEKLESIAICRDSNATGLIRLKRKIMPPHVATLILRFEKPTEVSQIIQDEMDRILRVATQDLEKALLPSKL